MLCGRRVCAPSNVEGGEHDLISEALIVKFVGRSDAAATLCAAKDYGHYSTSRHFPIINTGLKYYSYDFVL
jgi:hypothetical protein